MINIKIYPSNHKIKTTIGSHIDTDLNIPLAYINMDYSKYNINKNIYEDFTTYKKEPIIPNQEFDNVNIKIFNKFDEEAKVEDLIKRNGEKYYYSPAKMQYFYPKTFLYSITVKKKTQYNISNMYNINVSCVDDPDSMDLSSRLESIFVNPHEKGYLPPNVKINDNSIESQSLTTGSLNETDFLFIESPDGIYYDGVREMPIDFTEMYAANTNVWIGCDEHNLYKMIDSGVEEDFLIKFPILTKNDKVKSKISFDSSGSNIPGRVIHNIFIGTTSPVLIVENEGSAFQIISHSSVLKNPEKHANLIYEVMMYVYLNSYKTIPKQKEWITYTIPDYEVSAGALNKKNKFISSTNINSILNLNQTEYLINSISYYNDEEYKQASEGTDLEDNSSAISLVEISNGHPVFKMDKSNTMSDYSEPTKPNGWVSIYSDGKIFYLEDIHYSIESNIENNTFIEELDEFINIKIYPFKSTKNGINTKYDYELNIPLIKSENEFVSKIREMTYEIYIKNGIIRFIEKDKYEEDELSIKLFNLEIKQTNDSINIFDMRLLGGGLPEDLPDNYNLLDIGHINGRPYRNASTLIIRMPTKFKEYKDAILKSVNKYKIAEDYPIIFFEDIEEE